MDPLSAARGSAAPSIAQALASQEPELKGEAESARFRRGHGGPLG